jgi:hypothetical protein
MDQSLPGPRPCTICSSENAKGVKTLIVPRRGRIELSSRYIEAALYVCTLCGAIRKEPLASVKAA